LSRNWQEVKAILFINTVKLDLLKADILVTPVRIALTYGFLLLTKYVLCNFSKNSTGDILFVSIAGTRDSM